MTGSTDVSQLFQIILKSMRAKKCLELGCFTGYTTLAIAMSLTTDGEVITCDINDTLVQKNVWKDAGVDHKVSLVYILESINK